MAYATKTLSWFVVVLVVYGLFIAAVRPKTEEQPGTNTERNAIIRENFDFRISKGDSVLVGSSMSERLKPLYLGGIKNFAFSGGSSAQGLAMLARSPVTPKEVIVETNVLTGSVAYKDDRSIFAMAMTAMRRILPELRTANRPEFVARYYLQPSEPAERDKLAERSNPDIRNMMLAKHLDAARQVPDEKMDPAGFKAWGDGFRAQLVALKNDYITPLVEKGARIVFLTMPTDGALLPTPLYRATSRIEEEVFPPAEFRWIVFRDRAYDTTDGVHLVYGEAAAVAGALRRDLAE